MRGERPFRGRAPQHREPLIEGGGDAGVTSTRRINKSSTVERAISDEKAPFALRGTTAEGNTPKADGSLRRDTKIAMQLGDTGTMNVSPTMSNYREGFKREIHRGYPPENIRSRGTVYCPAPKWGEAMEYTIA